MAISFHPKQGMVLFCNFDTGFIPPEMVKLRRVAIISPYQLNKRGICTVVPFSTSAPDAVMDFHHCIPAGRYVFLSQTSDVWVKGDMLATISLSRLDRIRVGHNFLSPSLSEADFKAVQQCVNHYLDFN